MSNQKLTFDQFVYLLIGAPAIFFGWFIVSGVVLVFALGWIAQKVSRAGLNLSQLTSPEFFGETTPTFLALTFALIAAGILTRRSLLAGWPESSSPKTNGSSGIDDRTSSGSAE